MTPCEVKIAAGELTFKDRVRVRFDAKVFTPSVEEVKLEDSRLRRTWGERLFRVLLTAEGPGAKGAFGVRIVQA